MPRVRPIFLLPVFLHFQSWDAFTSQFPAPIKGLSKAFLQLCCWSPSCSPAYVLPASGSSPGAPPSPSPDPTATELNYLADPASRGGTHRQAYPYGVSSIWTLNQSIFPLPFLSPSFSAVIPAPKQAGFIRLAERVGCCSLTFGQKWMKMRFL